MSTTLRHLEIFLEVAYCGKINKAADKLYLSQSTVSQTIKDLEHYYNVTLFNRLSRHLYLTSCGTELVKHAERILSLVDEMDSFLLNFSQTDRLRIGASVTAGTYIMNKIMDRFQAIMPQAQICVCVYTAPQVKAKILSGELDIALLPGDIQNPDLIVKPVIQDQLVFVCGREHPFFGRERIQISDLENQDFVLRESTSSTRKLFDRFVQQHQLNVNPKWICGNTETVKLSVLDNRGMTLISKSLVEKECAEGRLHIVSVEDISFERPISLVYHRSKYMDAALKKFCELCENFQSDREKERAAI